MVACEASSIGFFASVSRVFWILVELIECAVLYQSLVPFGNVVGTAALANLFCVRDAARRDSSF